MKVFKGQISINEKKTYFGLDYELTDEIGNLIDKYNQLEKENQQLKEYNKFLMKKDNTLQSLIQWLYKEKENIKYSPIYINCIISIINKIKELEMSDK